MSALHAQNVATLIATDALDVGEVDSARIMLELCGLRPLGVAWLEPGQAADIYFDGEIDMAKIALVSLTLSLDIAIQPVKHRRKMLLISDMDSTMITVECIDELADYAGIKPQIAEITERAMQGELDFAEALRARVKLLAGLDEAVIAQCLSERVKMMPGAETLVRTMAGWGAHTVLISGGFTHFAHAVAQQIGFAESFANQLDIANNALTGTVSGQIVDAAVKQAQLEASAIEHGLSYAQVLAVGDGANDIPMIQAAGLGAAYHAKPKAAAAADFAIVHNDLTALLYAQGIPRSEWATSKSV
jgi:phosphoserine phosphatase